MVPKSWLEDEQRDHRATKARLVLADKLATEAENALRPGAGLGAWHKVASAVREYRGGE